MGNNSAGEIAKAYFSSEKVIAHYFRESHRVGLWKSEQLLFERLFSGTDRLLDLGCGTGRIAFGLEALQFTSIDGADFSEGMIDCARQIGASVASSVRFRLADARRLPWDEAWFEGVIFGFNGFFMIPGDEDRRLVLSEIYRVLKPGGRFVFTGHDRELSNQESHWKSEKSVWIGGNEDQRKSSFGDVIEETDLGTMYIHSTTVDETAGLLKLAGFNSIESWLRLELAMETGKVREFSDECRFWVAVKE